MHLIEARRAVMCLGQPLYAFDKEGRSAREGASSLVYLKVENTCENFRNCQNSGDNTHGRRTYFCQSCRLIFLICFTK